MLGLFLQFVFVHLDVSKGDTKVIASLSIIDLSPFFDDGAPSSVALLSSSLVPSERFSPAF